MYRVQVEKSGCALKIMYNITNPPISEKQDIANTCFIVHWKLYFCVNEASAPLLRADTDMSSPYLSNIQETCLFTF